VLEESYATKEQQDQLLALSRQMLELEDGAFKLCLHGMPMSAIDALFIVTGGLESGWSLRTLGAFSERAREMSKEGYPDKSAEPINAEDAADCIENLPLLMEGQPWPEEECLSPEETDACIKRIRETLESTSRRKKTWKYKLSLWKWERMNSYYELRDWFRSKFCPKK